MPWLRVTKRNPCVICEKGDWCTYTDDGEIANCMRIASDRPAKNGNGYIHRLKEPDAPEAPFRRRAPRPCPPPPRPAPKMAMSRLMIRWSAATTFAQEQELAQSLGVTVEAIRKLGASWSPSDNAWAFPMKDQHGATTGIRLRSMDGSKWAVKGSRSAMFLPSVDVKPGSLCLIPEGPTDTAACLSYGFYAIGRHACRCDMAPIRAVLMEKRLLPVIVADNDPEKMVAGELHRIGMEAAVAIGKALKMPHRIIVASGKDIRQMYQSDPDPARVHTLVKHAKWRK